MTLTSVAAEIASKVHASRYAEDIEDALCEEIIGAADMLGEEPADVWDAVRQQLREHFYH